MQSNSSSLSQSIEDAVDLDKDIKEAQNDSDSDSDSDSDDDEDEVDTIIPLKVYISWDEERLTLTSATER